MAKHYYLYYIAQSDEDEWDVQQIGEASDDWHLGEGISLSFSRLPWPYDPIAEVELVMLEESDPEKVRKLVTDYHRR